MYAEKRFEERIPESKPEFGTLAHLIAWCRTKPADKKYPYGDGKKCFCQQYYADQFPKMTVMATSSHVDIYDHRKLFSAMKTFQLPPHFNDIASGFRRGPETWTFGQALERALAVQKGVARHAKNDPSGDHDSDPWMACRLRVRQERQSRLPANAE
jgi:hypothetical protein